MSFFDELFKNMKKPDLRNFNFGSKTMTANVFVNPEYVENGGKSIQSLQSSKIVSAVPAGTAPGPGSSQEPNAQAPGTQPPTQNTS